MLPVYQDLLSVDVRWQAVAHIVRTQFLEILGRIEDFGPGTCTTPPGEKGILEMENYYLLVRFWRHAPFLSGAFVAAPMSLAFKGPLNSR